MDNTRIRPSFELVSFLHPNNPPGVYEYESRWVVNDDLHLIHTLRGAGETEIAGRVLAMTPGCVVFIDPFVEYAVRSDARQGLEMLNFHFHLFLDRGVPIIHKQRLPPLFQPSRPAALHGKLRRWFDEWMRGEPLGRASVTAHLHGLALDYWREFSAPAAAAGAADKEIEQLAYQLTQKVSAAFDAEDLAATLFLSVSQMNRRFRRAYGLAPKDFWLKHRYARARSTLHYSLLPISAIAREMGFEDANYFSRWFKKLCGLSPAAYRQQIARSGASQV